MGTAIHPTAIVDARTEMGDGVLIGPYVVIEGEVKIGDRTHILAGAHVRGWTEIGRECRIHMCAVVGHEPQDRAFGGGVSYVRIGDRNVIREYAQIHRGTKEGSETRLGSDNFLMATAHVGHNCTVGDNVTIANGALLAGYVSVEDLAFISGNVVVHQFARIGRLAMIGGGSRVSMDVPPYMLLEGNSTVRGLNVVGMKRCKDLGHEAKSAIKEAYRLLYRSGLTVSGAVDRIRAGPSCPEVLHMLEFILASRRGICKHA